MATDFDHHDALAVLREYAKDRRHVIRMVNNHAEVMKALELLKDLDKALLERWSDPNYG